MRALSFIFYILVVFHPWHMAQGADDGTPKPQVEFQTEHNGETQKTEVYTVGKNASIWSFLSRLGLSKKMDASDVTYDDGDTVRNNGQSSPSIFRDAVKEIDKNRRSTTYNLLTLTRVIVAGIPVHYSLVVMEAIPMEMALPVIVLNMAMAAGHTYAAPILSRWFQSSRPFGLSNESIKGSKRIAIGIGKGIAFMSVYMLTSMLLVDAVSSVSYAGTALEALKTTISVLGYSSLYVFAQAPWVLAIQRTLNEERLAGGNTVKAYQKNLVKALTLGIVSTGLVKVISSGYAVEGVIGLGTLFLSGIIYNKWQGAKARALKALTCREAFL